MKQVIVTTSWDDGHRLDLRLAGMLRRYRVAGTFYISPRNRELTAAERLAPGQVRALSADFEIGAHTMNHPVLTTITHREAAAELSSAKEHLAQITGQEVTSFCYPRGAYDEATMKLVKEAGYSYARTVERFSLERSSDPWQAATTLEAHRNPLPTLPRDLLQIARLNGYHPVATWRSLNWETLAKLLFDRVMSAGGVYHLWGHSWVVEREGDWDKLECVLAYIGARPGVQYLTNGELVTATAK